MLIGIFQPNDGTNTVKYFNTLLTGRFRIRIVSVFSTNPFGTWTSYAFNIRSNQLINSISPLFIGSPLNCATMGDQNTEFECSLSGYIEFTLFNPIQITGILENFVIYLDVEKI